MPQLQNQGISVRRDPDFRHGDRLVPLCLTLGRGREVMCAATIDGRLTPLADGLVLRADQRCQSRFEEAERCNTGRTAKQLDERQPDQLLGVLRRRGPPIEVERLRRCRLACGRPGGIQSHPFAAAYETKFLVAERVLPAGTSGQFPLVHHRLEFRQAIAVLVSDGLLQPAAHPECALTLIELCGLRQNLLGLRSKLRPRLGLAATGRQYAHQHRQAGLW